jgi:hypothetical protein
MNSFRTLFKTSFTVAGTLSLTLLVAHSATTFALAQDMGELRFNTSANSFESEGRPPSRTSAGSRDSCLSQIVAIVPGKSEVQTDGSGCGAQSETLIALTISEQPTFWFYIPEQPYANVTAELVLLDELQHAIAIQSVSVEDASGIIGVPLNQTLEVDVVHRWVFSVESRDGNLSERAFVEGVVQRIDPDEALQAAIAAATSDQDRVRIYANHGIWHDALTLLIELHQAAPSDTVISRDWDNFLNSVGLGAIAQAPFLNCCSSSFSP